MTRTGINVLKNRGYIDDVNIVAYLNLSKIELIRLLEDKDPVMRSIGARVISQTYNMDEEEIVDILLKCVEKEKKLYTRLELCKALEKGNQVTAKMMTEYLGKIGTNQHKELPQRSSLKKSYPLARDLMARSLGKMSPEIMPVLIEVLESHDEEKIAEVIDAIGYLLFYNKSIVTTYYMQKIFDVMEQYTDKEIIVWKCITCLSCFSFGENIKYLNDIIKKNKNSLLVEEAKRALRISETDTHFLSCYDKQ